jgi:ABC-type Fe3+ transport system permease subunit
MISLKPKVQSESAYSMSLFIICSVLISVYGLIMLLSAGHVLGSLQFANHPVLLNLFVKTLGFSLLGGLFSAGIAFCIVFVEYTHATVFKTYEIKAILKAIGHSPLLLAGALFSICLGANSVSLVLLLSYILVPQIYLIISQKIKELDPLLFEASQSLGQSPLSCLKMLCWQGQIWFWLRELLSISLSMVYLTAPLLIFFSLQESSPGGHWLTLEVFQGLEQQSADAAQWVGVLLVIHLTGFILSHKAEIDEVKYG